MTEPETEAENQPQEQPKRDDGLAKAVPAQQVLPGFPVPMGQQSTVAVQFGAQSIEAVALQRLTPEGVSEALSKAQQLEEKRLAVQERQLEREADQEERQRVREHDLIKLREGRRWRLGLLLLTLFTALVIAVFFSGGADAATKVVRDLGLYVLAFVGGMGAEKVRREWAHRPRRQGD